MQPEEGGTALVAGLHSFAVTGPSRRRLRRVTPGLVLLALLGMVLILLSGMEVL